MGRRVVETELSVLSPGLKKGAMQHERRTRPGRSEVKSGKIRENHHGTGLPTTESNCYHTMSIATLRGPPPPDCYFAHSSMPKQSITQNPNLTGVRAEDIRDSSPIET